MAEYSRAEKRACAKREAKMRRLVYGSRVEQGRMKPDEALREIEIMEAIAADYDEPRLL